MITHSVPGLHKRVSNRTRKTSSLAMYDVPLDDNQNKENGRKYDYSPELQGFTHNTFFQ